MQNVVLSVWSALVWNESDREQALSVLCPLQSTQHCRPHVQDYILQAGCHDFMALPLLFYSIEKPPGPEPQLPTPPTADFR